MNCFERVGMKVPAKRGGKCACGEMVRFDIVTRRAEHFLVCPVVERRMAKSLETLEVDEAAVAVGARYFGVPDA